MKLILVLHNIRSVYNVGAILRTAEGLGVSEVVCSGYTPRYDDPESLPHLREKLNRQIEKAALGAEKLVKQENLGKNEENLLTFLEKCATIEGYTIVGLENNLLAAEQQKRVILGKRSDVAEKLVKNSQNSGIVLVLGEEVHGIQVKVREKCDYFLEIPMQGRKESFNVSVATGIAVWGLMNLGKA